MRSGLRNLPDGSADSLGLFQQRPSQGWGTVAQIMDPVTSARAFYDRLVQVSGWQALPVTAAAQAVQHSGFPGAYAQWQPIATRLAASFVGAASSCAVLDANVVPPAAAAALPRHYQLPADTPVAVALAIRFALAQLGTAYQFGGSCTDAHSPDMALHCDCSSLVQQAYRAGGIALPRTTFAQVDVGTPVYALAALRAGDLLFTAGADGTPANPGHVGMYIGDGLIVQAPQTGESVQLSPCRSGRPSSSRCGASPERKCSHKCRRRRSIVAAQGGGRDFCIDGPGQGRRAPRDRHRTTRLDTWPDSLLPKMNRLYMAAVETKAGRCRLSGSSPSRRHGSRRNRGSNGGHDDIYGLGAQTRIYHRDMQLAPLRKQPTVLWARGYWAGWSSA